MKNREFTSEFRLGIVRRIIAGESVTALYDEYSIKRSVLYRWRDAYLKDGEAGLNRRRGRPPGAAHTVKRAAKAAGLGATEPSANRIAELERMVGKQALYMDFLERAFKRVKESRRQKDAPGGTASTGRSGQ
jgi:transposase-like protein